MLSEIRTLLENLPGKVVYEHQLPGRAASISPIPRQLHKRLYLPVRLEFNKGLYAHQTTAIEQSLAGRHVALATSTASGKSLCFILPTLDALLKDPNACALFVYPLKALSGDQLANINKWATAVGLSHQVYRLDGDVKGEDRKKALANGRLFICTPDILHATILRCNHDDHYKRIFDNLAYVVLDECHVYDGAFGSHMGLVVRRLRQVCKNHGSSPRFIMASATIGKPTEHVQNLSGLQDFEIITEDLNASPIAERSYYLVSPDSTDKSYGYILELSKALVTQGIQFVVFCNSRKEVEKYTESFRQDFPKLKDHVMPYRAGYQSTDRAAIEKALRQKKLLGVFSTSALEMGIDLPNLDVCIMAGLPNSQSSLLQRAGRVGRRRPGAVIICGKENPFDDYYLRRPSELFQRPLEHMAVNLSNTNLLISHYACARVESGNFDNPSFDPSIFGPEFMGVANRVNHFDYAEDILYEMEPHFRVSIRSIDDPVYTIGFGYQTIDLPIGEINYSQLMREAYFDGIYMHMGVRHRVKKIIFGKREVLVDRRCPFASTKPKFEASVRPKATARKGASRLWPNINVSESTLSITEKVTGYLEKSATEEKDVVYQQPLMRYFVTSGVVITLTGLNSLSHGAVVGLASALENAYPIIYRCARTDIGCHAWSKEDNEGHIYLYDSTPGGLGITANALPLFEKLLEAAKDGVHNCDCGEDETDHVHGCIKCVKSNMWMRYPNNTRRDTLNLLDEMLRVLAKSQATLSTPPEQDSKAPQQRRKYGKTMLTTGSIVYTGTGHEAVVLSSKPMEEVLGSGERLYTVQGASKESKSFLGSKLTLIQGKVEMWCLNCGTESISIEETLCPTCSERLI